MLKVLRHRGTQKKIFTVIAVTVVLGFVVSLMLISHDDKKSSAALATIGKRKISAQEYLNSYRAVEHQVAWMFGDKANEMRGRINFKGEAWDRLLLLDYAKKENIRVSDDEIVQWITSQTGFQRNGQFDEKFYEMYVQRVLRAPARDFEEEVRQTIAIGKIQEKLKTTLSADDSKLKELYAQERGEKSISFALLPWENFKDKVTVTDKDVDELYTMVQDQMKDPKTGQLMGLPEAKAQLKNELTHQKAAELAVKKLKEIKEKMKGGDFETVLKAENIEITPLEKYKKGVYPAGVYPSDHLEKAVSTLKEGEISNAFTVPTGAMIAKVTKILPLDDKKFAEEKEEFKKQMLSKKQSIFTHLVMCVILMVMKLKVIEEFIRKYNMVLTQIISKLF